MAIFWKLTDNVLYAKKEDNWTLKNSLNEQKYFLRFNMKKCHLFFVVADLFLSEINQINLYVTKCRMLQRNVERVLTTQTLWDLNIEQKFKKLIKIN